MKEEIKQAFSDIYNDMDVLNEEEQDLFVKMIIAEYMKCLITKQENPNDQGNDKAIASIEMFLRFLSSKQCRKIAKDEMPDVVKYMHKRKETDA